MAEGGEKKGMELWWSKEPLEILPSGQTAEDVLANGG